MRLEVPAPHETFEVVLEDGARIKVRRHGRPGGVRLFVSHGNGYAIDGYLPYWQHFLPSYEVIVFDFRNHGQNVPVDAGQPHLCAAHARPRARVSGGLARLGNRKSVGGIFHSMSGRTAMKHALEIGFRWDALVLFDPPNVPPPGHPVYAAMETFEARLTAFASNRRSAFAARRNWRSSSRSLASARPGLPAFTN